MSSRLFLIDTMSLVFRAFHAPMQMDLVSPKGIPTKAVYIFVRTLRKLLKAYPSDYIAVAFDTPAPTFRDELFKEYKANRPEFPPELEPQLPYVRKFCQAHHLTVIEKEGFEADDILGTLAAAGAKQKMDVIIVSGDEDLFQLVSDRVKILKPSRGEEVLCDEAMVEEILGVKPSQVVDWLALCGDPSDNIPGARPFPGQEPPNPSGKRVSYIGPKGATDLIRTFGTLEAVLTNADKVKRPSYRNALVHYKKEALLSRKLARIKTNMQLALTIEDLRSQPPDLAELGILSRELGFGSLVRELVEEASEASSTEVEQNQIPTTATAEAAQWLASLPAARFVALSFQVDEEEAVSARLTGLGFYCESKGGKWVELAGKKISGIKQLRKFLEDGKRTKSVHNEKHLRLLLRQEGIELGGVVHDPMLYSYLLEPLTSGHAFEDVVPRRMLRPVPADLAKQAQLASKLATDLSKEVKGQGLESLYHKIELPLSGVLAEVEALGVRIDPKILAQMSVEFDRELRELTETIYDLAGTGFDIDSPKQLGEVLFGKLKLPGGKRLKKSGQYSTDASVLEALSEKHELPRRVIEYRTRAKLKSTYIDALPKYIHPETGRVHTSFRQTVARTGRLSSANPNLQNIPIGDHYGQRIRSAFVPEPGFLLLSADYSQIELRVLAHLSEDPLLVEAFRLDEDIHSLTAQEVFGVPPGLQTHEHRRMAKAINYGVIYGLSSFGLSQRTGTSRGEAQQYIDEYFRRYSRVKKYLNSQVEEARKTGQVRTLLGRLRPIPEINSKDQAARRRAEREALNTPLQGTAADLMKLAMVRLERRLKNSKFRSRMILTVHDELVFELAEEERESTPPIVKAEMEGAYALRVPLKVDMGVGPNWKEAK